MLTVHVGLHKTGSTSIQVALRRALKMSAVVPQEGDSQEDEAVFERLVRAAAGARVISSESLLGSPVDGYATAPERVRLMADALAGIPYTLVVYLRPHLQWFESVYVQYVQEGGTETPEELVTNMLNSPYVHWHELLKALLSESGADRLVARAYQADRDVVADFFSTVALGKPPARKSPPRLNTSLTASQVSVMRALNGATSISRTQRQLLRGVLQQMAPGSLNGLSPLPEELQRQIVQRLEDDWVSLAEVPACFGDRERFSRGAYADEILRPYAGSSLEEPTGRDELARVLLELSGDRIRRASSLRARLGKRVLGR